MKKFIFTVILSVAVLFINMQSLLSVDLIGYFHNWNYSEAPYIHLNNVDDRYSYIIVSFAIPTSNTNMTMNFSPDGVLQAEFISKIQAMQSLGKKILLSIGGATSTIDISNATQKNNFVNSLNTIINTYGFDGIDIDIESGNSILITSGSTINNPTNQSMVNLIEAIKQIMSDYRSAHNKKMLLTMAPETAYVQGGQSGFGSIWGGYLPIINALRDSIDILQVQLYNSGTMYGVDGNIYTQGTADFIIAMTEATIKGFNTSGGYFNGLDASKVAIGLPACSSAAGGGFVDTNTVKSAINYLIGKGTKPGSYTLKNAIGYPTLRGMMTWSINWDAVASCGGRYSYANNFSGIFTEIAKYKLIVNYGSGSGNFKKDTTITIIANPAEKGYKFLNWSGSTEYISDIYNDTTTVTMPNKDIDLTANYEKIRYNLIIENGSGSGDYFAETLINIYAISPPKKRFTNWSGDTELLINSSNDSALIIMPYSNAKLTANFELIRYNLKVNNGVGTGIYLPDSIISIKADIPKSGYKFDRWIGDVNYLKNAFIDSTELIMPEKNIEITAQFIIIKLDSFNLNVVNGYGSGKYLKDAKVKIYFIKTLENQKFLRWSGDSSYIEKPNQDTTYVIIPNKDLNIKAEYTLISDVIEDAGMNSIFENVYNCNHIDNIIIWDINGDLISNLKITEFQNIYYLPKGCYIIKICDKYYKVLNL